MMKFQWRQLCRYAYNCVTSCITIGCIIYRAFISIAAMQSFSIRITKRACGCGKVFPLSSGNYVFSYFGIVTFQDCFNQLDVEPIGWNCVDLRRAACVSDGFSVCGHPSGFCWLCGEVLGERCLVSLQGASGIYFIYSCRQQREPGYLPNDKNKG